MPKNCLARTALVPREENDYLKKIVGNKIPMKTPEEKLQIKKKTMHVNDDKNLLKRKTKQ